jgi:hypothetical protein
MQFHHELLRTSSFLFLPSNPVLLNCARHDYTRCCVFCVQLYLKLAHVTRTAGEDCERA